MKKTRIFDAITVFIISIIIILFVNALLVLKLGIAGMAISEILMIAVPVGVVLLRKEKISERFNLRLPATTGSFFAAAVLMMGVNMWENATTYAYVGFFGISEQSDITFLNSFFANISPIVALIVVALVPAVCEELLFRGYLLDSFKGKRSKAVAVIISSILFSLVHFDPVSFNLYKLTPILVMALAFGYITVKTDSVLIPMIFHFINNATALISFYTMKSEGVAMETTIAADKMYLWYALAAFGGGLALVYFGTRFLSGKPRKLWLNVLVILISITLFVVGVFGVASSMVTLSYVGEYTNSIREDVVEQEIFTVEEDSIGVMSAQVMCGRDVKGSVVISDPEGKEIYSSDDPQKYATGIEMTGGEYTVTYTFDVPEGEARSYDVAASTVVVCVDGLVMAEQSN